MGETVSGYTYTKTYRKKDGTLSIYTYPRKHGKKGRPEKVIPEEIKKEIIQKRELGFTKRKLREEYNLSWRQVDKILGDLKSNRNSKVGKGKTCCCRCCSIPKVEENGSTSPIPKIETKEGGTSSPIPKAESEESETTACTIPKSEESETTCAIVKLDSEPDHLLISEKDEIDEIDEIDSDLLTPKSNSTDVLSMLAKSILEYLTGKKYSELKADYEKRGKTALQFDWNKISELKSSV